MWGWLRKRRRRKRIAELELLHERVVWEQMLFEQRFGASVRDAVILPEGFKPMPSNESKNESFERWMARRSMLLNIIHQYIPRLDFPDKTDKLIGTAIAGIFSQIYSEVTANDRQIDGPLFKRGDKVNVQVMFAPPRLAIVRAVERLDGTDWWSYTVESCTHGYEEKEKLRESWLTLNCRYQLDEQPADVLGGNAWARVKALYQPGDKVYVRLVDRPRDRWEIMRVRIAYGHDGSSIVYDVKRDGKLDVYPEDRIFRTPGGGDAL